VAEVWNHAYLKLYLLSVIFFWQPTKTLLFENRQQITILWKYLLKCCTTEIILIAKLLLPKLQYCLAIQNHLCKRTLHNANLIKDLISRTSAPALNGSYSIRFSHKRFCCRHCNSVWQFCHFCLTYTAKLYCIVLYTHTWIYIITHNCFGCFVNFPTKQFVLSCKSNKKMP